MRESGIQNWIPGFFYKRISADPINPQPDLP